MRKMNNDKLTFKISSGLKNIIGRDLITDDFVAIFELVKNSYDAHANKVIIEFENLNTSNALIRISDNGKGMNYDDLINKWLFVAYSAKSDGSEDEDYRDKIQRSSFYAGAKGIGRFSCDKLGSKLRLVSQKDELDPDIQQIIVDWDRFELDSKEEFMNIAVEHSILDKNPYQDTHGTILEITGIRKDANWNPDKLIRLKRSLSKLINPFENNEERDFQIELKAEQFISYDSKQDNETNKINGLVENNLLALLNEKTIKISSKISPDGETIETKLTNNGDWLFSVTQKNSDYLLLRNILVELYYLNRRAKINFTRTMGVKNTQYGSVFLYKNGIRVYPFGEPGEDLFSLDTRQQRRVGDHLGTRELIGRIEISGENDEFKETTSRDGGLIKNPSYDQLLDFFTDVVISRLENFWKTIYKYGLDLSDFENKDDVEKSIINSMLKISKTDEIIDLKYSQELLSNLVISQEKNESAQSLLKSIEKIAFDTKNPELATKVKKIKTALDDALTIADIAEDEVKQKERLLKEKETQNLFLKSVKSQDLDEMVSFMHSIGIYSDIIKNFISGLYKRANRNDKISNLELADKLRQISFENRKILAISQFATKANFKLFAEEVEKDVVEFIREYLLNIVKSIRSEDIEIIVDQKFSEKFICKFKPIELTIIIDNLVSNSIRAKFKEDDVIPEFTTNFTKKDNSLVVSFRDNGVGISDDIIDKIFDFGFTTTSGSGLGLYHILNIVNDSRNLSIKVNNKIKRGVEFNLIFNEEND